MAYHLLDVLIPAIISAFLLWEAGVQCRSEEYSLRVVSPVFVQEGRRVEIPCEFTYPALHSDPHAQLYGYWYVENKQSWRPRLVATNNPERTKEIDPQFRHCFEVSGPKLKSGDCSLTINNAEAADKAAYHFQIEKGHKKWSYSAEEERLSVFVGGPPSIPRLNGHLRHPNGHVQNLSDINHLTARVGDSLLVRCEENASPPSNPTWVTTPLPSITQEHVSDNELKFCALKLEHGGKYICKAKNQFGSSWRFFYLHVAGNDDSTTPWP